jgi:all-trans-retinol 13,14-reductase
MHEGSFEAVVIGSGLGGLTAAALLAKSGRKVCVIERNNSLGGAASIFKHGELMVETALHQTTDPRNLRDPKHDILKALGLLDEIKWVPVSPFLSVCGGPVGECFDLPTGFDAAREAMVHHFPNSRLGIDRLLALVKAVEAGVFDLSRARDKHSAGTLCAAFSNFAR